MHERSPPARSALVQKVGAAAELEAHLLARIGLIFDRAAQVAEAGRFRLEEVGDVLRRVQDVRDLERTQPARAQGSGEVEG